MGSVAHNILHIPSWGVMDCVVEGNLQVCLLTCFITQPFQRNNRLVSLVQPSQADSSPISRPHATRFLSSRSRSGFREPVFDSSSLTRFRPHGIALH